MNIGVGTIRAAAIAIDLHRGHLDLSVATMPVRSESDADRIVAATVTEPIFWDKENVRRDR